MSAIAIPDPLPPAITPPRTVIEFLVIRTSKNSATLAGSHAPGIGSCTEADPGRSATWTVTVRRRRAAIGGHPRRGKHCR
jgi:hypothetical protein